MFNRIEIFNISTVIKLEDGFVDNALNEQVLTDNRVVAIHTN